jgi:hypothetical protein
MVAGYQIDRDPPVGNLFEGFKCHGNQSLWDFAAV